MNDVAAQQPHRFLVVTWNSGGGSNPSIGLAGLLRSRGHLVRVLGPRSHRARIEAAGCEWRAFPAHAEFDPGQGRALEDQTSYVERLLYGSSVPEGLIRELQERPADGVIIDYQIRSAVAAAIATSIPTAALIHTAAHFHARRLAAEDEAKERDALNETMGRLDRPPIEPAEERVSLTLFRRCALGLVVMPQEFDLWESPIPTNVVHVGPIAEGSDGAAGWGAQWRGDETRPLVVVSLSSQYMHQEDLLSRILGGLDADRLRVLALTGFELDPGEIHAPLGVEVRRYVPHREVLPSASLVITHAGMGTVMAAFTAGVPMLCLPLGRDQEGNARQVESLGAGRALRGSSSKGEIRRAVSDALDSTELLAGARKMAEVVARYGTGSIAVRELEAMVTG